MVVIECQDTFKHSLMANFRKYISGSLVNKGSTKHILNWISKNLPNILFNQHGDSIKNTFRLINEGACVFHFVELPFRGQVLCMT